MKKQAEAATLASTMGGGSRRRRAFVGKGDLGRSGGSGALSLRQIGLLVVIAAAVLAIVVSPASAATSRPYQSQITEAGSPPAPLTSPAGVAVDSSDNLYVSDSEFAVGPGLIDKFGPTGTFLAQGNGEGVWTGLFTQNIAFSDASGLLYVADSNKDDIFGTKGSDLTNTSPLIDFFGSPEAPAPRPHSWDEREHGGCCVISDAVDNSAGGTAGDIYVSGNGTVSRIQPDGEEAAFSEAGHQTYITANRLTGPFTRPQSMAVDPTNGDLYVADKEGAVYEFEPSGMLVKTITAAGPTTLGEATALAVDPTSGNLLIAEAAAIYELSSSGAFEGKLTAANSAPFGHIAGLAVSSTGTLYVSDSTTAAVDIFAPAVLVLTATTGPTANLTDTTATLNGTVNDAATPLTGCRFEYVSEAAFQATGFSDLSSGGSAECVPAAGTIPVDSADHPVHADITGLTPGVVYRYRLLAANATEENIGGVRATPTIVTAESVSDVSADSADLEAEIDPNGAATGYHFEYLTQAAYEQNGNVFTGPNLATVVPFPDAALAAGETPVAVSRSIAGLAPATTYLYRVAVTSSLATVDGPTLAFTTQAIGGLTLPDDRGWELVSPASKLGGEIHTNAEVGIIEAAAEGDAITYFSNAPTEPQPEGNAGEVQVLSRRTGSGWTSSDIASPHQRSTGKGAGNAPEYRFFADDLSAGLIQPYGLFNPELSAEASEQTPYLRTLGSCAGSCYRPLVTSENAFAGFGEEAQCEEADGVLKISSVCGPMLLAATPDLGHVVLSSAAELTPGAGREQIYEWSAGRLRLVSVLPPNMAGEELPAPPGAATLAFKLGESSGSSRGALSAGGSRVFWEADGNLYVRDTEAGHEQTLQLDAAEPACLQAGQCQSGGGRFQIASTDGSHVFFTDDHRLTEDSGAKTEEPDLYECVVAVNGIGKLTCELTDITPADGSEPAAVLGDVLGASADGSSIYFVAQGAFAPGAQPGDCKASGVTSAGTCNLYLHHAGTTRFVATLSAGDETDWIQPTQQPTRVSPDGTWLAFMSQRPLTGYDNRDAVGGKLDAEIFLYDAATGKLHCVSCDPTGARPVGVEYGSLVAGGAVKVLPTVGGQWSSSDSVAALLPQATRFGTHESAYQSRYLSDSGRLFFNSLGALVPQDSNGIGDVYEYEPPQGAGQPGSNSCTTASSTYSLASAGCVDLISSGTSPEASGFLDASENGDDVFFSTYSKLTPKDVDSALDIYDARVGGGEPQVVNPPACEGDACQTPAVRPNHPTPGTALLNGAGNVLQCPKGKVKQKGKCVKQKQKKKGHKKNKHKKSKKKKGKKNGKNKRTSSHKGGGGK